MKREIFCVATADKKQLPKQWGGMQLEDNITQVVYDISEIAADNILWRIDFDSPAAGYDPSENLEEEERANGFDTRKCVSRFIPYKMTRFGGEMQVTLVGTEINSQGEAVGVAYTVPFFVFFTEVDQHEIIEGEVAENVSAAEESALNAAQRAKFSADEAEQYAKDAKEAQGKTEEAQRTLEEGSTIIFQGGDASNGFTVDIIVDNELSQNSTNPVANRVITQRFEEQDRMNNRFENSLTTATENYTTLEERVTKVENDNRLFTGRVHVIEYGESGIWYYEKYSNGIVKMYATQTDNCEITDSWGNQYRSTMAYGKLQYPFELYQLLYFNVCPVMYSGYSASTFLAGTSDITDLQRQTPGWRYIRPEMGQNATITVAVEVIGRIKGVG